MRNQLLMALAVVALAAFALGAASLRRFVHESPAFCAHCHRASPEFAAWTTGQHKGMACQKCHHSSDEDGLAILKTFLVAGGPHPGARSRHARVEVGACAACHLSHDPDWPQVGSSRGHRIHAVEKKIACVQCHAHGIHRFEPARESCQKCHGPHAVAERGMQQVHCFACHDFTSDQPDLKPSRKSCLRCHRAEGVLPSRFPDDAPMQFACAACHKPHEKIENEHVACESCHKDLAAAGLHAGPGHAECARCHRPHGWRTEREDCLRCHKQAASHYGDKRCAECHGWSVKAPASPLPDGGDASLPGSRPRDK